MDFAQLATQCAPAIHANTLAHVVRAESGFNPFAIGVVGAHLARQPRNKGEAIATAAWLGSHHFNYSVGLAQINQAHFAEYGLTVESGFDPCRNLRAAAGILRECYVRAYQRRGDEQAALRDTFSCYYSGNFTTGYKTGYVISVVSGHAHPAYTPVKDLGILAGPPATSVAPDLAPASRSALVF
jgi:type IV secretion system protein VirB1